jgi:Arc/MetJ family transcription regulator
VALVARTNIDLDDAKVDIVIRRYGVRTKTEAVDLALSHLVGHPLTVDEALGMHGRLALDEVAADVPPRSVTTP